MYKYFLVKGSERILLFESQFQFLTEDVSLSHYEKGLAKGLFKFDRSRINQIWTELALWGLIGRVSPVELVRILCAFGCELQVSGKLDSQALLKSFRPVTYFIPMSASELSRVGHFYHCPLEPNSTEHIPLFLEMDDRLLIGSFYTTVEADMDLQFPRFCDLLEQDLCLPDQSIAKALFKLFWCGNKIEAQDQSRSLILASRNVKNDSIQGINCENSLFYLKAG